MQVKICPEPFDPWQEVQAYQAGCAGIAGRYGATCVFIGTMRDFNDGDAVRSMLLDYYPGMTEKYLQQIVREAQQHWEILDALIIHRAGTVYPQQPIVAAAVWAPHRGDAFEACREIMEALKSRAPFWKKEHLASDTERWVEKNTCGYGKRK